MSAPCSDAKVTACSCFLGPLASAGTWKSSKSTPTLSPSLLKSGIISSFGWMKSAHRSTGRLCFMAADLPSYGFLGSWLGRPRAHLAGDIDTPLAGHLMGPSLNSRISLPTNQEDNKKSPTAPLTIATILMRPRRGQYEAHLQAAIKASLEVGDHKPKIGTVVHEFSAFLAST